MKQQTFLDAPFVFDRQKSDDAKADGMRRAADARPEPLQHARHVARELCEQFGETNADIVGTEMKARYGIDSLGPAAGSLFKVGFVFTGRRVRSTRISNHARELKVWRLEVDGE